MNLQETLELMKGKDLVELFNEICEEGQEVKKFRNKQAGIAQLLADFDEEALMTHIASKGGITIGDEDDDAAKEKAAEPEDRRSRHSLSDDAKLSVLNTETRSRCALDILSAIDHLGEKATVGKVIEKVCGSHVAPRSLVAKNDQHKPGFVRGYVTHMIRNGFLEVE